MIRRPNRASDAQWVNGTPPPPSMSVTEMSQRWPASVPENLALPLGQWTDRDAAERLLMSANGTTERETAQCWVNAMLAAGLLDVGDGTKGALGSYRLLPPSERPGAAAATQRERRLEELRRELEELGVHVGGEAS